MERRIPPATLWLAVSFVAAHVAFQFATPAQKDWVYYSFALYPVRYAGGADGFTHWYEAVGPILGHVFLHGGRLAEQFGWIHLFMNMLAFVQAGPMVEQRLGALRFVALFFISSTAGAVLYIALNEGSAMGAVGASGAVCGVFGAYFLSVGRNWREALAIPQVRNGMIVFLVVNVGLAAVARMTGFIPIAWEAHLGGFVAGAIACAVLAPRRFISPWAR